MNERTKEALIDLLYRLGDDSLVIGHRNSEWTGLGPILEEDIAFSSMAQDKMGHALAFYNLLHALGEPDPDQIAYARGAAQYRCCSLVALDCISLEGGEKTPDLKNNPERDRLLSRGDWAQSLARQFLFSEADAVRMSALEGSAYEPLAQLARKLRGELKYHTMHGRLLMERLGRATEESRGRLQSAVEFMWPHALGMFEPTEGDGALAEAGICPTESALRERWGGVVDETMAKAGLTIPSGAKPYYGGRKGRHPPQLAALLDSMQQVNRLDPAAAW